MDKNQIQALAWAVEQAAAWEGAHTGSPGYWEFKEKLKEADLALVALREEFKMQKGRSSHDRD